MGLINRINGNLLSVLASQSPSSSGAAPSSLGGKGVSASFDTGAVSLSGGLSAGGSAFRNSALRLNQATLFLEVSRTRLDELVGVTDELIDISGRAQDPELSRQDRNNLTTKFNTLIGDFKDIVASARTDEQDFLKKEDLGDILEAAGINVDQASTVSEAFKRVGGSDGDLGQEAIKSKDVFYTVLIGGAPVTQTEIAPSGTDPLNQSIANVGAAFVAENTLRDFREEIAKDRDSIQSMLGDVTAALEFSIAGSDAFDEFASGSFSINEAGKVAADIVAAIRTNTNDQNLSAHSDLDVLLSGQLIGAL